MTAPEFRTVADLLAWLRRAPTGTQIATGVLAEILAELADEEETLPISPAVVEAPGETWRERLWTVPAETRLGVVEAAEALGRPRSFIYARTGKAEGSLPHRKLDGSLRFTAGELRAWIRSHEEIIAAGPMEFTRLERGGLRAV